ncbi:MAG: response regulator [Burkholderiales bacterium]|nr:response regulator [Phycisphaerae bacterium]
MAKVLLIDDHADLRDVIEQLLKMHGHTVECRANADDALEDVRQTRPDVLIVDQRLPGMSGLELLRVIRRDQSLASLSVIICSADDSSRDEARLAGAQDFWVKGSEKLMEQIAQLDGFVGASN